MLHNNICNQSLFQNFNFEVCEVYHRVFMLTVDSFDTGWHSQHTELWKLGTIPLCHRYLIIRLCSSSQKMESGNFNSWLFYARFQNSFLISSWAHNALNKDLAVQRPKLWLQNKEKWKIIVCTHFISILYRHDGLFVNHEY